MIQGSNQYVFWVTSDATKPLVKDEIEKSYGVHVESVNILRKQAKPKHWMNILGRGKLMKKAMVVIRKGETLNVT